MYGPSISEYSGTGGERQHSNVNSYPTQTRPITVLTDKIRKQCFPGGLGESKVREGASFDRVVVPPRGGGEKKNSTSE